MKDQLIETGSFRVANEKIRDNMARHVYIDIDMDVDAKLGISMATRTIENLPVYGYGVAEIRIPKLPFDVEVKVVSVSSSIHTIKSSIYLYPPDKDIINDEAKKPMALRAYASFETRILEGFPMRKGESPYIVTYNFGRHVADVVYSVRVDKIRK